LKAETLEEIFEREEYFFCERFRCRMKKSVCIERQKKKTGWQAGLDSRTNFLECLDCVQGGKIREEAGIMEEQEKYLNPKPKAKECIKCHKVKPLEDFSKNKLCKDCQLNT